MRDAPSVVIIKKLLELGAKVRAYDPAAMEASKFYLKDTIEYAQYEYDTLKACDALLILTVWNEFRNPDFDRLKEELTEPLIFDGRNIYSPEKMKDNGFVYYSIGRVPINLEILIDQDNY